VTATAQPFHTAFVPSRRRWRAATAMVLLLLCDRTAWPQDVTEQALKAALVYNFAKFTEWPEDALKATTSFTACALGDDAADALARAVKDRRLAGRGINVLRLKVGGPVRSCHLLYVSGAPATETAAIMAAVRGAPVLTISDAEDFGRLGGIAFVFVENGRMRFDINLDVARRARLQLSSKMLALAAHVLEGPAAPQP
jgi:uncharacterized protein DUF4154